jgi:MYXO-CTERM domain-containing protein
LLGALLASGPAAAQTASARNVTLKLTIPDGVTKVKGILAFTVRGLASGWGNGAAMQGLAKRLEAGIVMVSGGDDLNDNSYPNRCASGEFNGIPEALVKLAAAAGHPEIAHAPLVGIGHSHGGDYWNWFTACHPERMALVFVHASGGVNYNAGALKVPVLYELGTGDLIENGSKKPRAGMFVNRSKGAVMALVIGQGEGHDQVTAASLNMIIELIEAIFKLRVPANADTSEAPVRLNEIDEAMGNYWLGDLYSKEIAPYSMYMGNKALTAFLPNEEIARKWKMTGPGLPASIMLPTGTCSWCGNPKDEPKATPGGPVAPPNNNSPADASTGGSDAGVAADTSTGAGGSGGSGSGSGGSAGAAGGGAGGASATGGAGGGSPPANPGTGGSGAGGRGGGTTTPPPTTGGPPASSGSGVQGGCSVAPGAGPGVFALALALALLALARRRRT